MPNYKIETKELILKQNPRTSGIETFVYEPSTIDEETLGNLYIIGWLTNNRQDLSFISNVIASVIRREFYKQNPVESRSSSTGQSVTQDPYTHFESAIQKANETIKDVAKTNKNILEDIGICAVNIVGNKIRFSFIGECTLLLFRDNNLIKMNEVSNTIQSDSEAITHGFANIVNGDIEEDDKFIFSTFKVMDLFSDTGIIKLFQLSQNEQADIITKIYQKNSKDTLLPDQATIILDVKSPKIQGVLSFTKSFRAKTSISNIDTQSKSTRKSISESLQKINPTEAIKNVASIRPHRNTIGISAIVFICMIVSFISIAIYAKYAILAEAQFNTLRAEEIFKTNKDEAMALLEQAQNYTFPLISVWYTHNDAVTLLNTINRDINRVHNIYIDPPIKIGTIPTSSIKFKPKFIIDDTDLTYVFGQDPLFYYKLDKKDQSGSFTSTTEPLKQYSLNIKKPQNKRDTSDALYTLNSENNKILKKSKLSTLTDTFLLGTLPNIIDFTISSDDTRIYILTENQIFILENSK